MEPATIKKDSSQAFMTSVAEARPLNGYEQVADLLPEVTDSIDKIQVLQARFELCTKKKFWKKLKKLEEEFLEAQ